MKQKERNRYAKPCSRMAAMAAESRLLTESLPVVDTPTDPHVTRDDDVYAKPRSVWDVEEDEAE